MFSLNSRYLSPRHYEYFRQKFNCTLPHSSTIRKWFSLSTAGTTGGFVDDALNTLSELVEEHKAKGLTITVAISFDEMSMRKHVQWLHHKKKFAGFINFGTLYEENEALPVANNVIVIMLNGINVKLTLPIAYFFITTLIAEEKAILIATITNTLTNIGIRVKTITSDGLITNFAAYEILGASFDDSNIVPYFNNPDSGEKIFVFHDAPHMLKLVRNCLGDEKVLRDRENRLIEWKFVERLYRAKVSGLCSHKLTKRHIEWKQNPMKVNLAAQTISASVAQSIKILAQNDFPQFANSEGTVDFFCRFNNTFDIFNADKEVEGNIYKTPINSETREAVFNFIDDMVDYINGITLKGKNIVKTSRNTGFKGFLSNFIALKMMYEEEVETNQLDKICTTAIQQDLLESFFGRIRSASGDNSNPSQQQFCANFSRAVINKELTSSTLSNCIDKLDILTISSQAKRQKEDRQFVMIANGAESVFQDPEEHQVELPTIITEEEEQEEDGSRKSAKKQSENLGIANVAGIIEASIERNAKFNCNECAALFEQNEKIDADLFVKHKRNVLPCKSTFEICDVVNKVISSYLSHTHESRFDYSQVLGLIHSELSSEVLFQLTDFEHNPDHKKIIVNLIIDEIVRMRFVHQAREITISQFKDSIRSSKRHDVHFAGQ